MGTDLKNAASLLGAVTIIPAAKPKKKGSKERDEHPFGEDMDYCAALSIVADALVNQAELIKEELKRRGGAIMAADMARTTKKPEAFIGTGPRSSAYVGFRRKGSNSALDSDIVATLQGKQVRIEKQEKVPARLVLNPDVLENQEQLAAIAEAITTHPKLQGVPVILRQDAEFYYSTGELTMDDIASAGFTVDELKDMLPRVGSVTVGKFQIDGLTDPRDLLKKSLEIIAASKLVTGIEAPKETTVAK